MIVLGGYRELAVAHRLPGDRWAPILCIWNSDPNSKVPPCGAFAPGVRYVGRSGCPCAVRLSVQTEIGRLLVDTNRNRYQVRVEDLLLGGTEPGMGPSVRSRLESDATKLEPCLSIPVHVNYQTLLPAVEGSGLRLQFPHQPHPRSEPVPLQRRFMMGYSGLAGNTYHCRCR